MEIVLYILSLVLKSLFYNQYKQILTILLLLQNTHYLWLMKFVLILYLFNILRTYINSYVNFKTGIYKIRINYV